MRVTCCVLNDDQERLRAPVGNGRGCYAGPASFVPKSKTPLNIREDEQRGRNIEEAGS